MRKTAVDAFYTQPFSIGGEFSLRERLTMSRAILGFPGGATGKELACQSLGREDPLEEGMGTQSSILAWRIPWTEEPGRLHTVHRDAESRT